MVTLKIKLEPSNRFNQSMYSIFIPPQNPAISRVLNSKLSGNIPIYCENKLIILRLAEQIHYRIRILAGFDLGEICCF